MLPLPKHLCKRILNLEYIEMADLHPEAWLFEEESTNKTLATMFKRREDPVTSIQLQAQCYTPLVAVLAQEHTDSPPPPPSYFMVYLATIIRAHHNFEGLR